MRWTERVLLIYLAALATGCDSGVGSPVPSSGLPPGEEESVSLRRIRQHDSGWTTGPQFQADWWRSAQEENPPLADARHIRTSSGNLVLSSDGSYKLTLLLEYATRHFELLSVERELVGRFERYGNMIRFDPDRDWCDGAPVFGYASESALMVYLGTESAPSAAEWSHHARASRLEFDPIRVQPVEDRHSQSYEVTARLNGYDCSVDTLPHDAGAAGMSGFFQQRLDAATLEFGQSATIRAAWTESNIGGAPGATNQLSFELTADYERAGNLVYFGYPIDSFGVLNGDQLIAYQLPMLSTRITRVMDLRLRLPSD